MAVDIIARGLAGRADSKAITAYEYAKRAGYTGTEQEFAEDMGNSATNASNARASAEQAQEYAEQAEQTLANKADIDGYYGGMGVGIADNLNANTKIPLTKPYVLRPTAESEDVAGLYKRTHLTGGSLVWNQLVQNGDFASDSNWAPYHATKSVSNNEMTVTVSSGNADGCVYQDMNIQAGHKFLVIATTKAGTGKATLYVAGVNPVISVTNESTSYQVLGAVGISASVTRVQLYAIGDGATAVFKNVMCIDLTTTFGTTFANAIYSMSDHGVAWLYANFPELNGGYIPYSAPHFEHSKYKGVTSDGVNQWDEVWELGYWNMGNKVEYSTTIRSKNKIPILPNTTYYCNQAFYFTYYDVNGDFLPHSGYDPQGRIQTLGAYVFTTPSNAYYMTFNMPATYGTTYKNDIMILIHYDTSYDDTYEPYESWYTDLGSDVLKGIPVADDYTGSNVWSGKWHWEGDTKTPDGTITENWDTSALKDLEWQQVTYSGITYYRAKADPNYTINTQAEVYGYCTSYNIPSMGKPNPNVGLPANGVLVVDSSYIGTGNTVVLRDDSITSVADLKTALDGKGELIFRKATPTTSQGTAYEENEQCHNWGIQYVDDAEYDDGNRAFKMPMGGEEVYTPNLTEKVEAMPSAPVNNGDYIVRVENNKAEYIPLPNSFPEVPTSVDGTYDLVATVSNGTATLSWVARS